MTGKERLQTTLAHREPDRVCVDFGATPTSGIHVSCVAALREHFGLEARPVMVHEPYQMLGWIDDDLLEALGVDTLGVPPRQTMFGFPNENWRPLRLPWGQEVLVSEHFRTTTDAKGDLLIYPEGDTSAPPSGRMPVGSFFFDTIVRQEPIVEERLDPADNLEEFGPLTDADLAHFRTEVARAAATDRGVVANFGGTAFGDIALVPAPFLKHPKGIRDISEWYMSTALRPDYIHAIFERQCEIALENLARVHAVVGNAVDVVFVCGTDFGTQTGQFCSADTFRTLWAPSYRRINDWIHTHTTWKTFKHSCGAVAPLLADIADCGFDIINPVQCSATGMDPRELKARHGERLVFWGGGVDTQKTLPFGTPDAVYREVRERIDLFAPGGGFVFNTIHNVQANTPVENLVALFRALRDAAA